MSELIPCIGGIGFFFLLFSFIVAMRYMSYRETLALAEKGLARPEKKPGNGGLVWGILFASVGFALCLGLYPIGFLVNDEGGVFPLGLGPWLLPGLMTMFLGLGLIIAHVLTRDSGDKPPKLPAAMPPVNAPAPLSPVSEAPTRVEPPATPGG